MLVRSLIANLIRDSNFSVAFFPRRPHIGARASFDPRVLTMPARGTTHMNREYIREEMEIPLEAAREGESRKRNRGGRRKKEVFSGDAAGVSVMKCADFHP